MQRVMSSFTSWRVQEGEFMAEKKERGRFSIKFNENDPSHAAVIELLEKQGAHSKAQFIANAIQHYVHCTETPDIHSAQVVDKAVVEEIVMEILKRQGVGRSRMDTATVAQERSEIKPEPVEPIVGETENHDSEIMDESLFSLISDTMSAFRGQ